MIRGATGLIWTLAFGAAAAGCMVAPNNGDVETTTNIASTTVSPSGYFPTSGATLQIQVLSSGAADPAVDGNWQTFTTGTSGGQPYYFFSGDAPSAGNSPLYQWTASAASPVLQPSNWPQGGVARIRAQDNGYTADIFDSNWLSCPTTATTYQQFGTQCRSYTNYAVLVSATPTPADNAAPPAGRWLTTYSADPSPSQTQAYYTAIGAGPGGPLGSLTAFKTHFGFGPGDGEASAIYFNNGDLGLGRSMHCKKSGSATACYVTNYADRDANQQPIFGGTAAQQQDALQQAISNTNPIATVAMVYDPTQPAGQVVKFIVYSPDGSTTLTTAKLDNHAVHGESGTNIAVPTNCMACHGGGGSFSTSTLVTGAHFLPFDPYSFVYSTNSSYTQSALAPSFQALNLLVYNAGATAPVQQMLQAMYGPSGPVSGTTAQPNAIPSGWQGSWNQKQLYSNVVGPYCRTCHTSRDGSDELSFATYADFSAFQADVLDQTCQSQDMPHAEQTQRNFWGSGARAHLIAWAGATGACAPQ